MFCSQCGVQMANDRLTCPLCGTSVRPDNTTAPLNSQRIRPRLSRNGAYILVTSFALLIIAVTLSIDLSITGRLTWAGYAAGITMLCYVIVALPLWMRSISASIKLAADWGAVMLYLFVLEQTVGGSWFLPIALPITILFGTLSVGILLAAHRYPLHGWLIGGVAFLLLGLVIMGLEVILLHGMGAPICLRWSPWVMLGCGLAGVCLLVVAGNRGLQEQLAKRMFL